MKILIDTSFLLTSIKEGIDIFDIEKYGQPVLPREVIDELNNLREKGKPREKEKAKIALQIIEENKSRFENVKLGESYVDKGILDYVEENNVSVATLDKDLKEEVGKKSKVLTIKAGKRVEWA